MCSFKFPEREVVKADMEAPNDLLVVADMLEHANRTFPREELDRISQQLFPEPRSLSPHSLAADPVKLERLIAGCPSVNLAHPPRWFTNIWNNNYSACSIVLAKLLKLCVPQWLVLLRRDPSIELPTHLRVPHTFTCPDPNVTLLHGRLEADPADTINDDSHSPFPDEDIESEPEYGDMDPEARRAFIAGWPQAASPKAHEAHQPSSLPHTGFGSAST